MAKDPAFLFYSSDFLTGTMYFTNEQTGIYIKLLCSQHQHGGIIDKVVFNNIVGQNDVIRAKFIETENGFFNERLIKEMELRAKKSNNISAAVKEVWEKRKNEIAMQSHNKTMGSHNNPKGIPKKNNGIPMRIEDEIEDEIEIDLNYKGVFEKWLSYKKSKGQTYKNKTSIEICYKKLLKLSNNNPDIAEEIINDAIANSYSGFFALKNRQYEQPKKNSMGYILENGQRGLEKLIEIQKARNNGQQ